MQRFPIHLDCLLSGKNTLSRKDATNRKWKALLAAGNRIIFMEQKYPLHYQSVPSDHDLTEFDGSIAFSQNLEHPIFDDLQQSDLDFWGKDEVVYRNAMRKPTRGAISLVQVDDALKYSAMLEVSVEDGMAILNQMAVAEKLNESVVARHMFDNMIQYAASYKKEVRPVTRFSFKMNCSKRILQTWAWIKIFSIIH